MNKKISNNFSVALGLTDYINPMMYLITVIVIISNINNIIIGDIDKIIYIIGVILSIIFGYSIPTIKLLVGLGKIKFKLPVNLVFFVNTGLFISGLMLIKNILNIKIIVFINIILLAILILIGIFYKTKNFNNDAVIIGGIGYLLIYISLIYLAISSKIYIVLIFYIIAILLYIFLIIIGLRANLKDAKIHWIIEISNIICQASVAIGTIILFRR